MNELAPERAEAATEYSEVECYALLACVDLLPPKAAEQFWHNWRTHPYLERFMEREERLAALAAWREAR